MTEPFRVVFSPESQEHLRELRDYLLTKTSRQTTSTYIRGIVEFAQQLGATPFQGEQRIHLRPGIRTIGYRHSVSLLFEVLETEKQVNILAILYQGRTPAQELHRQTHQD